MSATTQHHQAPQHHLVTKWRNGISLFFDDILEIEHGMEMCVSLDSRTEFCQLFFIMEIECRLNFFIAVFFFFSFYLSSFMRWRRLLVERIWKRFSVWLAFLWSLCLFCLTRNRGFLVREMKGHLVGSGLEFFPNKCQLRWFYFVTFVLREKIWSVPWCFWWNFKNYDTSMMCWGMNIEFWNFNAVWPIFIKMFMQIPAAKTMKSRGINYSLLLRWLGIPLLSRTFFNC